MGARGVGWGWGGGCLVDWENEVKKKGWKSKKGGSEQYSVSSDHH